MTQHEELAVFSPELKKFGELLLHHQCWFFGRDILHPDGNLLVQYGFKRYKAPKKTGTNRYRIVIGTSVEVDLWGFGLFYGDEKLGRIFVRRYDFSPQLFEKGNLGPRIFESEDLPSSLKPARDIEIDVAKDLTRRAVDWILTYEDWVEKAYGKEWRRKCLREWPNSEFPARRIKTNWQKMAKKLR